MTALLAAEDIRNLFYDYAHCVDDDRLEEWPDFFTEDASYRVIPRENLDREPPFAIIYLENRNQMCDRILIIREALVHSLRHGRHIIGNVRVAGAKAGEWRVEAGYLACMTDVVDGVTRLFSAGKYDAAVVFTDEGPKFKRLDVILDTTSVDRQMAIPL